MYDYNLINLKKIWNYSFHFGMFTIALEAN